MLQGSLLGFGEPSFDAAFLGVEHFDLGAGAWLDYVPGWAEGHDTLFDQLRDRLQWQAKRRPMYDRVVDVPRLLASDPHGVAPPVVAAMREALEQRYGAGFSEPSFAYYRDGNDSVAWHGDKLQDVAQSHVATVSLGSPRRFAIRPAPGAGLDPGLARRFELLPGDLVVMGGTMQRTWLHTVPKVACAGPRIVIMFRPIFDPD